MAKLTFPLWTVFVAFAVLSATLALITQATWFAFFVAFNLLILLLLGTLVAAAILKGRARAFFFGFSIFGIGYAIIANSQAVEDYLGTNVLLNYAYFHYGPKTPPMGPPIAVGPVSPVFYVSPPVIPLTTPYSAPQSPPVAAPPLLAVNPQAPLQLKMVPSPASWNMADYDPFIRIGHCLFSLLCGLFGGMLGLLLYSRRISREKSAAGQPNERHHVVDAT